MSINKTKRKRKSEKGSITLFVLIAILFFIIFAVSMFAHSKNNLLSQNKHIQKIQSEYDVSNQDMQIKYEEVIDENKELFKPKITITPNTNSWTNQDITVEISFSVTLTQNKKITCTGTEGVDYEIEDGKVIVKTNNQTITVEASEKNGKKVTEQITIDNIDKTIPTVALNPNGGNYIVPTGGETTIKTTITAKDEGGSGLSKLEYVLSTSKDQEPTEGWKEFTNEGTITEAKTGGTYYLWTRVTDEAGNRAEEGKISNVFTVNYQVKYDANGGTGEPEETVKVHDTDLTLSDKTPTRTGYTFVGWATSKTATKEEIKAGGKYTNNSSVTLYAVWTANNYTITYDNNNYLFGLDNIGTTAAHIMNYSVSNGVVTVTATGDDGYGYTNGRVYLEAGKTYVFSCTTSGTWGKGVGDGTVEAFLMHNGTTATAYYHMASNTGHEFTPTASGIYYLRLDVNKNGATHTFSNIKITEKGSSTTKTYGTTFGTLPTPSRPFYTFKGWYTAPSGGTQITTSTSVPAGNTTYYAQWTASTNTARVENVTYTGYDVYIATTSTTLSAVRVPTWTNYNGQDDLGTWTSGTKYLATKMSSNYYYYRVNVSDHNYESGTYISHVYIYDASGTGTCIATLSTTVPVNPDKTPPSAVTVTYNGGANTCTWKNNYNITLSATDNTAVSHYEIDWNSDGVVDQMSGSNFIPGNGFHTHTARFRAVDVIGNVGPWTGEHHIHMDTGAPGATTVTYNSGSNTCTWKNNYNITLSATDDVSGVAHYEIDWTGDGVADGTTASNFIPWNGYSSCNNRFRAVDYAGNKGTWSEVHHIHMDTEAPSKTTVNLNGYTSGAWTAGDVTQTASATDNVGIAKYQYSHDNSNWSDFPNPWTINWDGYWNFYVRAVDHAGNVGASSNMYTINRTVYQINNASYVTYACTLEEAYNKAENGATIYLLKNFSDGSTASFSKNLTLNTNGKILTRGAIITINAGYTVTVNGGGTIKTTVGKRTLDNKGTLNVENFTVSKTNTGSVIGTNSGATTNVKAGVNFSHTTQAVINNLNGGTTNVQGGTLTGNSSSGDSAQALVNHGTMTISGGTIKSTGTSNTIANYDGNASLKISGGTITGTSKQDVTIANGFNGNARLWIGGSAVITSNATAATISNINAYAWDSSTCTEKCTVHITGSAKISNTGNGIAIRNTANGRLVHTPKTFTGYIYAKNNYVLKSANSSGTMTINGGTLYAEKGEDYYKSGSGITIGSGVTKKASAP